MRNGSPPVAVGMYHSSRSGCLAKPSLHDGRMRGQSSPGVAALEVGRVNTAQNQLASLGPRLIAVEPEGEDGVLDHALLHQVLEGGDSTTDGDAWEAKTLQE